MHAERDELYRDCLETWGRENQLGMLVEECAELIVAVRHYLRGRTGLERVLEEVADVLVVAGQARVLDPGLVDQAVERKILRLRGLLDAWQREIEGATQLRQGVGDGQSA